MKTHIKMRASNRTMIFLIMLMMYNEIEGKKRDIKEGKARCVDFRGIKREMVESIKTKVKESNRTVFLVQNEIEVVVMTRDVWNAYCYHGSAIDPNTGCDPKGTTVLLPDKAEAKTWYDQKRCKIGNSCSIDQEDCKGDNARKCLTNELTHWVKENNGGYESWWMRFPHHTCAKTWNCKLRSSTMTPVLISENEIRVEINIMNEWYSIYSNGEYQTYFVSKKNQMVIYVPKFKIKIEEKPLKCIDNNNSTECVVTNSITGNQEIVELVTGQWSIGRTTAIKNKRNHDGISDTNKQREEVVRAASINDLKRVILSTHYTQAEIDENFEKVNMNFLKIANMIIGLIEYNTKKDDKAFSIITGEDKLMKWISPKIVRVCKINKKSWMESLGCKNGSHYAGGSYHSTLKYKCYQEGGASNQYSLDMKLDNLKDTTLYDIRDLGTTSSEKINRELIDDKIRKIESKLDRRSSSENGISGLSNGFLSYLNPSSLFSTISSYLVYINSALIVLLTLRR